MNCYPIPRLNACGSAKSYKRKGACRKTGFSRHVVLRTRISVEQARILSHSATTRGKGRRAIPPWQTRRGNTCGVRVSEILKAKYTFIEQYLILWPICNDAGQCRVASELTELWRELQLNLVYLLIFSM